MKQLAIYRSNLFQLTKEKPMNFQKLTPAFFLTAALSTQALAGTTPDIAAKLGLTDVETIAKKKEHYGQLLIGTLPDGARIEIELDRDGVVEEIEPYHHHGNGFAAKSVEALIPAAVLGNASYPKDATLYRLELDHDDHIEMEGRLASSEKFKAEFSFDGKLLEMKTDD